MKERIVFPSPRISERAPFGTGATVRNIIASENYCVYNFELFKRLKRFYDLFPAFDQTDIQDKIPVELLAFIGTKAWNESLAECRKYSSSSSAFLKRMYDKFDAFFIVKFLNSFDEQSAFPPVDIHKAVKTFLCNYGIKEEADLYEQMLALDSSI
jgi:hypothetical protein